MALGDGNGDGNRVSNNDGDGDGDRNGNGHGKGNGDKKGGCLFMCWQCPVLLQGRHLASTPMDTKESAFTSNASWG